MRLVGGLVDNEGTVELCQDGAWNSLCYKDWKHQEAFVVCRQLGLPATGKEWDVFSIIIQKLALSFAF